jgi:hypothetical protein
MRGQTVLALLALTGVVSSDERLAGARSWVVDPARGQDASDCGSNNTNACKSLQYALNLANDAVSEDIEVVLEPGAYLGACSEHGSLVTKPSATIRAASSGVIIDCEGIGKLLNYSPEQTFKTVSTIPTLSLVGLTVYNGFSRTCGGAIRVRRASLVIEDCHFRHMQSDSRGTGKTMTSLLNVQGGGAICAEDMLVLSVVRCSFIDCRAPEGAGGAIFMVAAATSTHRWPAHKSRVSRVVSSTFESCLAAMAGGAVAMAMKSSSSSSTTGSELLPDMSVHFERGTFKRNQLEYFATDRNRYWGNILGGSVCVFYTGSVGNITNRFLHSDFAHGSAYYNATDLANTKCAWPAQCYLQGVAVALRYDADATNVTSEIEGCNFNNHTSRSEGGTSGLAGGALEIAHSGLASNVKAVVATCIFRNTAPSSDRNIFGGTFGLNYHAASGVTNIISDSQFLDSDSTAGKLVGFGEGGAVFVYMAGTSITNVSTNITGCTFKRNLLKGPATQDGIGSGGAVLINYDGYALMDQLYYGIHHCMFAENNVTTAVGQAEGAGLAIAAGGDSAAALKNLVVAISSCNFVRNKLAVTKPAVAQGSGLGNGAGVEINLYTRPDGLVENANVTVLSCVFEDNVIRTIGSSYGAGLYVYCQSNSIMNAHVTIQACQFRNNKAITSSNDGGYGGGSYICADTTNVEVTIQDSVYVGNFASNNGGAIWAVQRSANPASNLQMIVTPVSEDEAVCKAKFSGPGAVRQWDYGAASLQLVSTTLTSNEVGVREDGLVRRTIKQKAFGGALYVGDLKTSIESCVINSNYAASSGGGIHLAGGSASLSIQGNTVVDENMAGESGTAIYSESGGGIALRNTSSVNFVSGVAASGIAIIKGGLVQYGHDAALQCAPGEQLLQNLSSSAAIFGDWKIDCKQVEVSNNGSKIEYIHETCNQLMIGVSPLHTAPCSGLPLTPPMLMTAGTVSW